MSIVRRSLELIKQTVLKKYCSLIHGQPVLEAVLKLKRDNGLTADDVESVVCDIFQSGFDIAGGGAFGPKDRPQTKEQADYNLKYLIAAALLDDAVGPAQLEPSRIRAGDAQALLGKVEIHPDVSRQDIRANSAPSVRIKGGGKSLIASSPTTRRSRAILEQRSRNSIG